MRVETSNNHAVNPAQRRPRRTNANRHAPTPDSIAAACPNYHAVKPAPQGAKEISPRRKPWATAGRGERTSPLTRQPAHTTLLRPASILAPLRFLALLLLALHPATAQSPAQHYELGVALFQQGRLQEAQTALAKAVEAQPRNAFYRKTLGVAYAAAEDYDSAEPHFRQACQLQPKDPDACYYHGRALFNLNRFEASLAALQRAVSVNRRPSRVHLAIAQAHEGLARAEEAERSFRQSLKLTQGQPLDPDYDPAYHYGLFLQRQGRMEEALAALTDAVNRSPDSPNALRELARVLMHAGRTEEAAHRLERSVALAPRDSAAHLLLAKAYARLGRAEDAERHTRLAGQGSRTSR